MPGLYAFPEQLLKAFLQTVVDLFPQLFAGLEVGHKFGWQLDSLTRFRITPGTRGPVVKGKTAKPPDFYSLTIGKRLGHVLNDGFHSQFDIFNRELGLFGSNQLDQFGFRHEAFSSFVFIRPLVTGFT
jgi:hypothetical protein